MEGGGGCPAVVDLLWMTRVSWATSLESYFMHILYMYEKIRCAEQTRQTAIWAGWPSSTLCMPIVALRQPRLIPSKP